MVVVVMICGVAFVDKIVYVIIMYYNVFLEGHHNSVNGVVVTWNPSKVQLGVRFPLNAHFFHTRCDVTQHLDGILLKIEPERYIFFGVLQVFKNQWVM